MKASSLFLLILSFSGAGVLAAGCSSTVTSVGAIDDDAGSGSNPPPSNDGGGAASPDSSGATDANADVDAHSGDGATTCPAGECGARVCGRNECGHVCGLCAGAPTQGGCFMGSCTQSCPGTPCL